MNKQIAVFSHEASRTVRVSEKKLKKLGRYPKVSLLVFDKGGILSEQCSSPEYHRVTTEDGEALDIFVQTQNKEGFILLS